MPDVYLRPRDAGRGTYDQQAYVWSRNDLLVRAFPRDASRGTYDVQVRPAYRLDLPAQGGGPAFPTQYAGFRIRKGGVTYELCLVATADAPTGMGGQPRMRKGGVTYAIYLVETTDPNASAVRMRTSAGTKSVRLKT